jgi:hypothetical protein
MSDVSQSIMNDMLSEIRARNTGIWKVGGRREDKANISHDGRPAVCIRHSAKCLGLYFPADVVEHLLDPDDGSMRAINGRTTRWIRVSSTHRLSLYRHSREGHYYHKVRLDLYQGRKANLLKLVALAQAELLDTLAQAKLLIELRHK